MRSKLAGDVEAGAEDDGVDLVPRAVRRHDSVGLHAGDGVGHQRHVIPLEGRPVVVGEQDPLAADRVVGRELARTPGR